MAHTKLKELTVQIPTFPLVHALSSSAYKLEVVKPLCICSADMNGL